MLARRVLAAVVLAAVSLVSVVSLGSLTGAGGAVDARGGPALVRTDAGWVRGSASGRSVTFEGIPYAAPPVGSHRWAPPAGVTPWAGVRDATTAGPVCPQVESGPDGAAVAGDEDCLYLNVTAPRRTAPRRDRLPVVVWLHGGGFTSGAGSQYGAAELATAGDVMVVTVNYRLGALGFLSSPALDAEGYPSGNYGLADQVAALEWVQRNAARFGGDGRNVTLAGQSSGARSVCAQLASPASSPRSRPGSTRLFHRAILQSGPCTRHVTKPVADQRGARVAAEVGCGSAPRTSTSTAACLREQPVAELLATLDDVGEPVTDEYAAEPWQPVVGTPVLPRQPLDAVTGGAAAGVPLLVGTMRDEMRTFAGFAFDPPLTPAGYRQQVEQAFTPHAEAVLARYPVDAYASPTLALATVLGDWGGGVGTCTVLETAETASAHSDVFAYELLEDSGVGVDGYPLGAFHSWDLPFLFDVSIPNSQYPELTAAQRALSATMIRQWARFAATGNPNGPSGPNQPSRPDGPPHWPELGRTGTVLGLAAGPGGIAPTPTAEEHQCEFWSSLP
jgi:para-nitrobenzyl esterase